MRLPDYRIVINMRIPQGYVETGHLLIGEDGIDALELFNSLEGVRGTATNALLRLDLVARSESIDTIIDTLGCNLGQLSENIKVIAKETFRLLNLKP